MVLHGHGKVLIVYFYNFLFLLNKIIK